ncbi:AAA family ATPase [Piscinibacter sp.]|uniref:bifunctional aminoglycoside phosphotransferase/ATP-binding protein n=1 Tax=Piscinibacter sp. TaxID=1903157 RepID=UPI002CB5FAAE|nr:AAA family ATPase [Albitalea sp.]HUG22740.1 AAA family ATPase [Albitalea sp.]
MPSDTSIAAARERVVALRASLEAHDGRPVRFVETHISWVLVGESVVHKLKKPVRLAFLDFTTLAARRRFCEAELRLNRRLAPSLYLGVAELRAGPGGPAFDGPGPVVDVAVRMRRFPDGALWSEMLAAGTLDARHIDAMAQRLAEFHRDAAVAPVDSGFGGAAVHQRTVRGLVDGLEAWPGLPGVSATIAWPELRRWLDAQLLELAPLWAARRRSGRVRECHGDLHLANVLQLDGRAAAFDGIEFDDELRWIDVLDDAAFLAMDLLAHGRRDLAVRFLDAYLEASGDHDGLPALRFFLVCRALVRAQVKGLTAAEGVSETPGESTADYLALAAALSRSANARLAITHGLPGSGKSFVSQGLLEAAGAMRVRSDVERKRLFGLRARQSSHESVPGGIYGADATARTYERLLAVARIALDAGWPLIVDAAFLRRSERAQFAALAASLGVAFCILDCRAEHAVLHRRLAQRQAAGGDASEADADVLERLIGAAEPLAEEEHRAAIVVDAARPMPIEVVVQRWLAA